MANDTTNIDMTIGYDAEGEKKALAGIHNITMALKDLSKEAGVTSTNLRQTTTSAGELTKPSKNNGRLQELKALTQETMKLGQVTLLGATQVKMMAKEMEGLTIETDIFTKATRDASVQTNIRAGELANLTSELVKYTVATQNAVTQTKALSTEKGVPVAGAVQAPARATVVAANTTTTASSKAAPSKGLSRSAAQSGIQTESQATRDKISQMYTGPANRPTAHYSKTMAANTNMGLKDYKFLEPNISNLQSPEQISGRLSQANKNIDEMTKSLQGTQRYTAAVVKSSQAEKERIKTLGTTAEKLAATEKMVTKLTDALEKQKFAVDQTKVLMENTGKGFDSFVRPNEEDSPEYRKVKDRSRKAFDQQNALLASMSSTSGVGAVELASGKQEMKTLDTTLKQEVKDANLREHIANIKLATEETARLRTENAAYIAQVKETTGLKLNNFEFMSGTLNQVHSEKDLQGRLGQTTTNLNELSGNLQESIKNTDAINMENAALSEAKKGRVNYSKELDINAQKIQMVTEQMNAQKNTLDSVNTVSKNTRSGFMQMTKITGELSDETVELKSQADMANTVFTASIATTKEQIRNSGLLLTALKDETEALKKKQTAQESRKATKVLRPVADQIKGAGDVLGSTLSSSASIKDQAKAMADLASKTKDLGDKYTITKESIAIYNDSIKANKLTMEEQKLVFDSVSGELKQYLGNLDEASPTAMRLKNNIDALTTTYENNRRALLGQNNDSKARVRVLEVLNRATKANRDIHKKTAADMLAAEENKTRHLKALADKQILAQRRVLSALQGTSQFLSTIGRTMMMLATGPLMLVAKKAVKFTADMEMNIKSLEILLKGDAEAAEQLYDTVTAYAAKTPYEIPELTEATKQLLAFGSAAEDVMGELSMLGDLAQNDVHKLESVTSAFGKVQARGVAHMRELNRFIMAGVPIIETLAKVTNRTSDELFKAVQDGKVGFDAVKQSLMKLTSEGERFYNMSEKLSETLKGRWSTLSDEINLALKAFSDDYKDWMIEQINKVIQFAQAMQTVSKEQRAQILYWAKILLLIAPIALALNKIVRITMAVYKGVAAILGLMGIISTVAAPAITAVVVLALALFAGFSTFKMVKEIKNVTDAFKLQEAQMKSVESSLAGVYDVVKYKTLLKGAIHDLQTGTDDEGNRNTPFPYVSESEMMQVIEQYTISSSATPLAALNTANREYLAEMARIADEKMEVTSSYPEFLTRHKVKEKYSELPWSDQEKLYKKGTVPHQAISAISMPFSELEEIVKRDGMYVDEIIYEAYLLKKQLADLELEYNNLINKHKKITKNIITPKSMFAVIKDMIGIPPGSAVNDMSSAIIMLSHITGEAITDTLGQFNRYIGLIPNMSQAREAMTEVMEALSTSEYANIADANKESWITSLLDSHGVGGNELVRAMVNYMVGDDTDFAEAKKSTIDFLDKLGVLIKSTYDAYVEESELEFEVANIGDIILSKETDSSGKRIGLAPEYIKSQAEHMAKAHLEAAQSAIRQLMANNKTLTIDTAIDRLEKEQPDLYANLKESLKTGRARNNHDEIMKLADKYRDDYATINKTDYEAFKYTVNTLLEEIKDTEFYKTLKDIDPTTGTSIIDDLFANYRNSSFATTIKSLKDERKELLLTAEAFKKFKYEQQGLLDPQVEIAMAMEKFNVAISRMKNLTATYDESKKIEPSAVYSFEEANKSLSMFQMYAKPKYREDNNITDDDFAGYKQEYLRTGYSIAADFMNATPTERKRIEKSVAYKRVVEDASLQDTRVNKYNKAQYSPEELAAIDEGNKNAKLWDTSSGHFSDTQWSSSLSYALSDKLAYNQIGIDERLAKPKSRKSEDLIAIDLLKDDKKEILKSDPNKKLQITVDTLAAVDRQIADIRKAGWKDTLEEFEDQLISLGSVGLEALIGGLEEVGALMANSDWSSAGDALGQSFASAAVAIMNALPQMLLQAGLSTMIAHPDKWWIGALMIASSGLFAIGKGIVNEKMNGTTEGTSTHDNTFTMSAKGNAFDSGRILNMPTAFRGANGWNMAGEAGTEAVLPLSRGSDGKLGVNSSGGGGGVAVAVPVTVNIMNQTGIESDAEVKQSTNADGSQNIEVLIKKVVNKGMATGEYDRTMGVRYGVKNRGIA